MIAVKKHETPEGHLLLAAADADLVGKVFEEDDLQLDVKESFYKEEEVDSETFNKLLDHSTHANLVGKGVIDLAIQKT